MNDSVKKAFPPLMSDTITGWKVRWGFGRKNYIVEPGLYQSGSPGINSFVLVTANYKLTFDRVLRDIGSLDAWLLVLDTDGVNVWCAAGKGTFGTDELIRQIKASSLSGIVSHRNIILPQLGAPGVKAHVVKKETGFSIIYGPVYSKDIPEFLKSMPEKKESMKKVNFNLIDRAVLIPVEFYNSVKFMSAVLVLSFIYSFLRYQGLNTAAAVFNEWFLFAGSAASGFILVPLLLPFIPFKSFALKGALTGIIFSSVYSFFLYTPDAAGIINTAASLLISVTISSYFALDFTGSTTFTSLSGVRREIRIAVPFYAVMFSAGIILKIVLLFL